jgi:hypothetical protein
MNNNKPRHFDPLKNKLPENWTNSNATKYYNRCWWKKSKCELQQNSYNGCATGDKWDPCGQCKSKVSQGCNPCSDFHKEDHKYFYTYNRNNCSCSKSKENLCNKCKQCKCKCKCNGHGGHGSDCCCNKCTTYNKEYGNQCCDDDVVIRYVANNSVVSCSNLVELKIPVNGSKARYLAQFSDEFIDNNRFQCVIPAVYNNCVGNVIDNRREEEFTESDQRALVNRNIKNKILAERVTTRIRHKHSIPSNIAQNGTYYYLGGTGNRQGSNQTGLYGPNVTGKPYFAQCNC